DDDQVGRLIEGIAARAGAAARFVMRTEAFFHEVDAWQPTHIAIDLVMPEMDGVEVLVRLAERGCGAKIIITSGVGPRVLEAARRSANEHGLAIAGVLPKPFAPSALRAMLVDAPPARVADGPQVAYSATRGAAAPDPGALDSEALARALANREFEVAYQPQVDCLTGELAGFEALVRWRHAQLGVLAPDRFIAIAEATGHIAALTEQVLEIATGWFAERFAGGDLTIAVNLSARVTTDEILGAGGAAAGGNALVARLNERCRESGLRPDNLVLELTESSAMENPTASLDLLTRLRMKGFQLSIDDFGTGYSSMLQLVRLPFSEIKVDKSFVASATRSLESRAVVESIVNLGQTLGLRVVAEGVEDPATLTFLRDAGCNLAQGYYIAAPMSGEAAHAWIESDLWRSQRGAMRVV
ncbi:MAG TPA: EAL domain-containing protein, partial [Steroidobacteraceae bacterium]|nr:EAL domain-containing protein [Steroidobacteraceae bacterium]